MYIVGNVRIVAYVTTIKYYKQDVGGKMQTNINNVFSDINQKSKSASELLSIVKMSNSISKNNEYTNQNNMTVIRTDTYSKSNDVSASTGIYSARIVNNVSNNSTTNLTSGANSYIKQKQRAFASQCKINLSSNLTPIVNNATEAKRAQQYYSLLSTPRKISYNPSYVVNQNTSGTPYSGNCANTSCHMMAQINSKGKYGFTSISKIGNYTRVDAKASDYNPNTKGYFNYKGLSKEELSNIIVSEIDHGRSVELHTSYSKGEHWVVVTGYTLDSSGNIKLSTENGRNYITGLSGIDPYPNIYGNKQVTDDLGKSATVATSGQWLNTDTNGYQVFTYNP